MAIDYQTLAAPGVQGLMPYQPGKPIDELAREFGLNPDSIIKLASNENPLGPSPRALYAAKDALNELCRYPDGNGFSLKAALSRHLDVTPETLTLGNGSNDVLEIIARSFARPGDEVIYSQYAFAIYALATRAIGATGVEVPASDYGHDLEAMAAAVTERTRLIFIANPNNPTGTSVPIEAVEALLERVPARVLVVLDEAYCEYFEGDESRAGLKLLPHYPNLIISRTFSKAWGLAAMRVGYGISSPAIADILNRVRQPFNVDSLAQAAATAVLDDTDYLARSRQVNKDGLKQLQRGFSQRGLSYIPSSANFVAVRVGPDAQAVFNGLLAEGVIVRPIGGYGLPEHVRVSVGLPEENARFLAALDTVLAGQGA